MEKEYFKISNMWYILSFLTGMTLGFILGIIMVLKFNQP
jgi:hypothetical protein